MVNSRKVNWQPLSMIPLFLKMVDGMLESAQEQLGNLQQAKHKPHVLDDEIIQRLLKLYPEQKEDIPYYLEQCQRWKNETTNPDQIKNIVIIENKLNELKQVNQQILSLVDYCKDRTINKILAKDDLELGLDFLTGKLDLP